MSERRADDAHLIDAEARAGMETDDRIAGERLQRVPDRDGLVVREVLRALGYARSKLAARATSASEIPSTRGHVSTKGETRIVLFGGGRGDGTAPEDSRGACGGSAVVDGVLRGVAPAGSSDTRRVCCAPMAHFRKSARATVELRARYRRDGPGSVLERSARVSDLGMGGAFLHDPGLRVGVRLLVSLTAPTAWEPLELAAEVRWIDARGAGVAFRSLTGPQATALRALVELVGYAEPR